jgi:hypothetical protein
MYGSKHAPPRPPQAGMQAGKSSNHHMICRSSCSCAVVCGIRLARDSCGCSELVRRNDHMGFCDRRAGRAVQQQLVSGSGTSQVGG